MMRYVAILTVLMLGCSGTDYVTMIQQKNDSLSTMQCQIHELATQNSVLTLERDSLQWELSGMRFYAADCKREKQRLLNENLETHRQYTAKIKELSEIIDELFALWDMRTKATDKLLNGMQKIYNRR